jgi:hypothetical protein
MSLRRRRSPQLGGGRGRVRFCRAARKRVALARANNTFQCWDNFASAILVLTSRVCRKYFLVCDRVYAEGESTKKIEAKTTRFVFQLCIFIRTQIKISITIEM